MGHISKLQQPNYSRTRKGTGVFTVGQTDIHWFLELEQTVMMFHILRQILSIFLLKHMEQKSLKIEKKFY